MVAIVRLLFSVAATTLITAGPALAASSTPQASAQPCIGDTVKCSSTSERLAGAIKWHPGHYMMIRNSHRHDAEDLEYVSLLASEPTITGILRDWTWKSVETSKGVFDFSEIDTYLRAIQNLARPKRFIIRIENRVFGAHTGSVVPDDMLRDPAYLGGEVSMGSGVVARIWEAPVMDRLIALMQALAQRYDSNPYVEGISTSETAIGFSSDYPAPVTFSNAALLVQLERYTAAARLAWRHSNVFVETNFLGSNAQMQAFTDAAVKAQAVVGGPDIVPGKPSQSEQIVQGALGTGTDYRGTVAIKSEIQSTELGQKWQFPLAQIYDIAYNINHANYILWDRNDYYGMPNVQWTTGILPFIRSIDGKANTNCPRSFASGCITN